MSLYRLLLKSRYLINHRSNPSSSIVVSFHNVAQNPIESSSSSSPSQYEDDIPNPAFDNHFINPTTNTSTTTNSPLPPRQPHAPTNYYSNRPPPQSQPPDYNYSQGNYSSNTTGQSSWNNQNPPPPAPPRHYQNRPLQTQPQDNNYLGQQQSYSWNQSTTTQPPQYSNYNHGQSNNSWNQKPTQQPQYNNYSATTTAPEQNPIANNTPPQPESQPQLTNNHASPPPSPMRQYAFASAEEAAAERRQRKRRLRIEPPMYALRRDQPPPKRDPNAPRLPDSTSRLVGPRLNLHNRVQSLIRATDLDAAESLARKSVFSRHIPTVFTCNAIIAAMYRAKRYDDAVKLFDYFFKQNTIVPNIVSYNNLINTHCDEGRVDEALDVYKHILENAPFSPSPVTYRHLTKGLIDAGKIGDAVSLLREMLNKGFGADSLVYNNVIDGFLKLGDLEKANELFDDLKERCLVYDGVVNATYMDWWFNQGKEKEAMDSYRSLMDREFKMTPATCNVLLQTLLKHGRKREALELFDQMLDNHTPPNTQAVNSETFTIMVNECFKLGKLSEAIDTFKKVGTKINSKPFAMDVAGYNNIITRFCEHGVLAEAENFFEILTSKALTPDCATYRTLIDTYLKMERIDDALNMLNKMVDANLRVVANFGTRVFEELIKNGKASQCAQIMTKLGERDPKPDPPIYDAVIRGLCDVEAFDEARNIIDEMLRYHGGATPALREYVCEAFGKVGRGEEIEKQFTTNRSAQFNRPVNSQFNSQVNRPVNSQFNSQRESFDAVGEVLIFLLLVIPSIAGIDLLCS
ncbi:hypothetical protein ACFE04_000912 [Oxalis oulophora]